MAENNESVKKICTEIYAWKYTRNNSCPNCADFDLVKEIEFDKSF